MDGCTDLLAEPGIYPADSRWSSTASGLGIMQRGVAYQAVRLRRELAARYAYAGDQDHHLRHRAWSRASGLDR